MKRSAIYAHAKYSEIVNSQINAALEQKWDEEEEKWMKGEVHE